MSRVISSPAFLLLAAVVSALLLTGCLHLMAAPIPMKTLADPLPAGEKARCLLVLLPGVADRAATFRKQGFIEQLRKRALSVDVVAADSTIGYYLRGIDAAQLEHDVVGPARAKGYEQIWMLGVSMGGYGTLHYAAKYPEHLDGIVTLSPHLGEITVVQSIRKAGGLARWHPAPPDPFAAPSHTEQTWRWVRGVTLEHKSGPEIFLGAGDMDPLVGRGTILAAVLPPEQVFQIEGGHSWGTWKKLWRRFLDESDFKDRCGAVAG
jgi:pimeloyl-ACP methyl ester carboxylesterase